MDIKIYTLQSIYLLKCLNIDTDISIEIDIGIGIV